MFKKLLNLITNKGFMIRRSKRRQNEMRRSAAGCVHPEVIIHYGMDDKQNYHKCTLSSCGHKWWEWKNV